MRRLVSYCVHNTVFANMIMLLVLLAVVAVILRQLPAALDADAAFYSARVAAQEQDCRHAREGRP